MDKILWKLRAKYFTVATVCIAVIGGTVAIIAKDNNNKLEDKKATEEKINKDKEDLHQITKKIYDGASSIDFLVTYPGEGGSMIEFKNYLQIVELVRKQFDKDYPESAVVSDINNMYKTIGGALCFDVTILEKGSDGKITSHNEIIDIQCAQSPKEFAIPEICSILKQNGFNISRNHNEIKISDEKYNDVKTLIENTDEMYLSFKKWGYECEMVDFKVSQRHAGEIPDQYKVTFSFKNDKQSRMYTAIYGNKYGLDLTEEEWLNKLAQNPQNPGDNIGLRLEETRSYIEEKQWVRTKAGVLSVLDNDSYTNDDVIEVLPVNEL